MSSALSGIEALGITGIGPASFASQILVDMGAEVIKISQPPKGAIPGVGQGVAFIEGMDLTLPLDTIRNKKNMGINLSQRPAGGFFVRWLRRPVSLLKVSDPA